MAFRVPYAINIEKETINNEAYRRVVWTGDNLQVVLMSLLPQEIIDMEIHNNTDQFIRVEKGTMKVLIGQSPYDGSNFIEYHLNDGDTIMIPQQHYHKIMNEGTDQLKIYTIYGPPNHPHDRFQMTKPDND